MAKSKYETHVLPYLEKIEIWAREGCTDRDIARNLGIAYSSFRKYRDLGEGGDERYAAFSATLARAKVEPDENVENALYRKATGYNAEITKHYKIKRTEYDPDTGRKVAEYEELVSCKDEVHVPADTNAQMFWLTNRRPDRWSYKPESGKDSDGGGVVLMTPVNTVLPPEGGGEDG